MVLYDAENSDDYLAMLDDDWRQEKLQKVRDLIKKHGPELEEGMEYKMLRYGDEAKAVFHLNAQRAYVSLYVGDVDKIEGARELLKDFSLGKGCIRIKKSVDLEQTGLEDFINEAIKTWRKGGDIGC